MNSSKIQMLGLFNVAPEIRIKDREERALETQLLAQAKEFFDLSGDDDQIDLVNGGQKPPGEVFMDAKEIKRQKDLVKQNERRERHLKQMDDVKKMLIDTILHRGAHYTVAYHYDYDDDENECMLSKEELIRRRDERERKNLELRDKTYFQQLQDVIEVQIDPANIGVLQSLKIERFPLLISIMDLIMKSFLEQGQPLLELTLNSTFITAPECLVLAENPQFEHLRYLDLSCNPITAKGLLYIVHPSHSKLTEKFQTLSLFNCEIDQAHTYLITNDQLQSGKVRFNLKTLNLSHNKLGSFLSYIVEFNLVNSNLETLLLSNCDLNDEALINLVSSDDGQKIQSLETIELSQNNFGANFILVVRQLRESCDFLQNLMCTENPGIKRCQNMQIAKSKKVSECPNMLLRLDLSNCLRGDEQVAQLAQSSYLKDLKWLNLRHCKFGNDGFAEVLQSKNLRSLEVLIVKDNKISYVEGPFTDLEEATEKQLKKGIMKLQLLDVRGNKLSKIFLNQAINFLKDTVVLMWDNPFTCTKDIDLEYYDPGSLFRSEQLDDDPSLIQNPMHIFTKPFMKQRDSLDEFLKQQFDKEFQFIYDDI